MNGESPYKDIIRYTILEKSKGRLISYATGAATANKIEIPKITVVGTGRLGYPLPQEQAATIISLAKVSDVWKSEFKL